MYGRDNNTLGFSTDRNQVIITRSSLECIGFMCKSTILATWLFVLQRVLAAIITDGSRPTAQTSRSADPAPVASPGAQPASQPASQNPGWKPVETGWKLGTKMRMSDPWPRSAAQPTQRQQPASQPVKQPATPPRQLSQTSPIQRPLNI